MHYDTRTRWNGARELNQRQMREDILVCVVLGVRGQLSVISAPSSHLVGVEENDEK